MPGGLLRTKQVTTATRLSVNFGKSMKALRMFKLMGRVDSTMSTICMGIGYAMGCRRIGPNR